jgi:predicted DCC family thiol-disulfide oxidoreductase YuxK
VNDTIVFYDGVCAMCNWLVRFISDREPNVKFAPLQGTTAATLLGDDHARTSLDSLAVRTASGEILHESTGMFYIAARMKYPWRMLSWARVLPRFLTNAMYKLVARTRYKLFGRYDVCRIPSAAEKARFLD